MAWWAWRTGHGAWGRCTVRGRRVHFYKTPLGKWGEDGKPQLAVELPTDCWPRGGSLCPGLQLPWTYSQISKGWVLTGVRGQGQGHSEVAVAEESPSSCPPGSTSHDSDRGPDGPLETLTPCLLAMGCCCVAGGEPAFKGRQPGRAGGSCRPS